MVERVIAPALAVIVFGILLGLFAFGALAALGIVSPDTSKGLGATTEGISIWVFIGGGCLLSLAFAIFGKE